MKNYSSLKKLNSECVECTSCNLSETRKNVVVGKGNESAQVVIIGEGPGEQEDITGLPFVGRAGKMLDTALSSVDIDPLEDCYITNIVKCRPPNNRKPSAVESEACMPWLNEQINLLKPKIIILAGSTAVQSFLGIDELKIIETSSNFTAFFISVNFLKCGVLSMKYHVLSNSLISNSKIISS